MSGKRSLLKVLTVLSVIGAIGFTINVVYSFYSICSTGQTGCGGPAGIELYMVALPLMIVSMVFSAMLLRKQGTFSFQKLFLIIAFWSVFLFLAVSVHENIYACYNDSPFETRGCWKILDS